MAAFRAMISLAVLAGGMAVVSTEHQQRDCGQAGDTCHVMSDPGRSSEVEPATLELYDAETSLMQVALSVEEHGNEKAQPMQAASAAPTATAVATLASPATQKAAKSVTQIAVADALSSATSVPDAGITATANSTDNNAWMHRMPPMLMQGIQQVANNTRMQTSIGLSTILVIILAVVVVAFLILLARHNWDLKATIADVEKNPKELYQQFETGSSQTRTARGRRMTTAQACC